MSSIASGGATLADYHWLVGPVAEPTLAHAAAEVDPVARAAHLRADLTAERARLVVEQVTLRRRGSKKFVEAPRLFFTPLGLEQATDGWIASYKAQRFGPSSRVTDLCCGIGGDLMALGAHGPVSGLDRDPIACLFAEANCRAVSAGWAQATDPDRFLVRAGEVDLAQLATEDRWHIDPDRRPGGRRSTQAELHDPPAETINRLLATVPAGAVKLAPAAELPSHWQEQAELEWISSARECRQLVAWFGPLAEHAA